MARTALIVVDMQNAFVNGAARSSSPTVKVSYGDSWIWRVSTA